MAAYDPQAKGPAPTAEGEGDRVAKALARAGVASRREVERLIAEGRVSLNGHILTTPAVKVGEGDELMLDGEVVNKAEPTRLFRYHKPPGLLTSHTDPKGRPTVFAALPEGLPRVVSIGRLDLASEGLLLLTNDGSLARALELPTTGVTRRYRARAFGHTTQEKLDKLKDGITIEGVRYGSIEATLDKAKDGVQGRNLWITVTLTEGKNREVRRVLEALDMKVNRLIRLSYGPFALSTLPPGEVEEVGPRVIRELLAEHIDPANLPTGDKVAFRTPGATGAAAPPDAYISQRRAAAQVKQATERPEKIERKPGWARPKPKAVYKGPPRKKEPREGAPPRPDKAKVSARKPGDRKPEGARSAGPVSRGPRPTGPAPRGANPGGSKPGGQRPGGPRKPR
jgi:23S rRNA pseudouridine2605 synthase